MKAMTCKELGGACDLEFHADTFDEMAELSKKHGMEMHQAQDQGHLQAMQDMRGLMDRPGEMEKWFESKRQEFEALSED
jgi:hypothetical protein